MNDYPFGIWTTDFQGALPAVYDQSLSYQQQVANLRYEVEKTKKAVEAIAEQLANSAENAQNALTLANKALKEVQGIIVRLDEFEGEYGLFKADTEQKVENINERLAGHDADFGNVESEIEDLASAMNLQFSQIRVDFSRLSQSLGARFYVLQSSLESLINDQVATKIGSQILVKDPITGTAETLNVTLEKFLNFMVRFAGITMNEYDRMEITMEEYDALQVSMEEYDTRAAFIFFPYRLKKIYEKEFEAYQESVKEELEAIRKYVNANMNVISPATGEMIPVAELAVSTEERFSCAPTVPQYAECDLTVEDYAAMQMTMNDYREGFAALWYMKKTGAERESSHYTKTGEWVTVISNETAQTGTKTITGIEPLELLAAHAILINQVPADGQQGSVDYESGEQNEFLINVKVPSGYIMELQTESIIKYKERGN